MKLECKSQPRHPHPSLITQVCRVEGRGNTWGVVKGFKRCLKVSARYSEEEELSWNTRSEMLSRKEDTIITLAKLQADL